MPVGYSLARTHAPSLYYYLYDKRERSPFPRDQASNTTPPYVKQGMQTAAAASGPPSKLANIQRYRNMDLGYTKARERG